MFFFRAGRVHLMEPFSIHVENIKKHLSQNIACLKRNEKWIFCLTLFNFYSYLCCYAWYIYMKRKKKLLINFFKSQKLFRIFLFDWFFFLGTFTFVKEFFNLCWLTFQISLIFVIKKHMVKRRIFITEFMDDLSFYFIYWWNILYIKYTL